jgi:peptidyl-tRNA hydrolase
MLKQIIIVRTDLEMPIGKAMVQAAHASTNATVQAINDPKTIDWLSDTLSKKITLKVNSEAQLLKIFNNAKDLTNAYLVTDVGLTVFSEPTITCCALGPDYPDVLDPLTKRLRLF